MAISRNGGGVFESIALLLVCVVLIYFETTRIVGIIILSVIVTFVVILSIWLHITAEKAQAGHLASLERAERKIADIVGRHIDTLANRRDTLVRSDRYGVVNSSDWSKEVQHFIDKVVRPDLTADESQAIANAGISSVFQRLIEDRVAAYCDTRSVSHVIPVETSPLDFEGMCAAVLRKNGWNASTTKGSGDQGADVVADRAGKKLVVQCKLYSGTVGNKAVQEVLAAKHYYSADIAIVVCRTEYSNSAKQLANISGVEIMTYHELDAYAQRTALPRN
jgi:restriction system protein